MVSGGETRGCFVRIDLPRFIQNASDGGLRLSPEEAVGVLTEWGFTLCRADLWHCEEPALASLQTGEILEVLSEPPPEYLDQGSA